MYKRNIVFSQKAYYKICILLSSFDSEVGFHGIVSKTDDKTYYVEDVLVYPQHATNATVDTDPVELGGWLSSLGDETINTLKFQGHSHVNMSVHPSHTDRELYAELTKQTKDHYIFMIVNKIQELWVEIVEYNEHGNLHKITDNEINVSIDDDIANAFFDEFNNAVKIERLAPISYSPTSYKEGIYGSLEIF